MSRNVVIGLAAAAIFALVVGLGYYTSHSLTIAVAEITTHCESSSDAAGKAAGYVVIHGGELFTTSGTASMEPVVKGRALVIAQRRSIREVRVGLPIIYTPIPGSLVLVDGKWVQPPAGYLLMHVAATVDADGIIPTGLNNARYENWGRVTAANFVAEVDHIFTWPQ